MHALGTVFFSQCCGNSGVLLAATARKPLTKIAETAPDKKIFLQNTIQQF